MKGRTLILTGLVGLAGFVAGGHYMNSLSPTPQKQVSHYALQKVKKTKPFLKKTKKQWKTKKKAIIPQKKNKFIRKPFDYKDLIQIIKLDHKLSSIRKIKPSKKDFFEYELEFDDYIDDGMQKSKHVYTKSTPANLLKIYIQPHFSPNIKSQLRKIARLPHGASGYVLIKDQIKFQKNKRPFNTHYRNRLEYALTHFIKGDYRHIGLLRSSIAFFHKNERKRLGDIFKNNKKEIKNDPYLLQLKIMNKVFHAAQQHKIHQIPKIIRQYSINNYRNYVLAEFSRDILDIEKLDIKSLTGYFHVHQDGEEPTLEDIEYSKGGVFPSLVISFPQNEKHRTRIYLVNYGKFSKIYEGFLKSKN